MLYDTHAHAYSEEYGENYAQIIKSALYQNVWLNNVGINKNNSAEAVKIANQFEKGVYAVVGLHPNEALKEAPQGNFDYEYYLQLARNPKTVGIGESGLDYYRIPEGMDIAELKKTQSEVFKQQIKLSRETGKTLVIHCRASKNSFDAYEDILEILKTNRPQRFEIHSFTANWQIAQEFLELGGYIALNGIITFDKTGTLNEVIKNCPLDKILLETDAPYLAPAPFRGKKNEPAYIKYVCEFIAEQKGISVEELAEKTFKNSLSLFGL